MADPYVVQIDLERVATNLGLAERRPWTVEQVKEFLRSEGFVERADGGWGCEELSLDLLDKTEIVSKRRGV